jgi:AraC-like DNA-binding protein
MKFDWLRNFLYFFAAVIALGAAFDFVNSFVVRLSYIQFFYFEIILALATYALAVAGYLRSEPISIDFKSAQKAENEPERQKLMSSDELDRQKARLMELIRSDRPYLDPQLTLGDLAKSLGVNGAVLSFVINNGFGKNFNDFINEFRIDDVKARINKRPADSLLAIAFDCGFNSKATFNRAFRKFTGSTPKQFQSK